MPGATAAVRGLDGDPLAQLLGPDGSALASSPLLAGSLAGPVPVPGGYRRAAVTMYDDDSAAVGRLRPEGEPVLVLVRRTADGYLAVGTSTQDTDETLVMLRSQLVGGAAIALAIGGMLGYVVSTGALRPIERMRARAAGISGRTAGERLPVPAADGELRRLAVTLNDLLDRLDGAADREHRFVAEASHDLRTPLALMLTEIELALDRPRPAEELRAALRSIEVEVRRLTALAEDLLGRVGGPASRLMIEARDVDLVVLAGRVVERFAAAAAPRVLTLVAPGPVVVPGDARRLDQAVSNLVDNALRHGAGDVEVAVRAHPGGATVVVSDHGDGFTHAADATGSIGLAIVAEIAHAHGGAVEVRRDDGVTCVSVELVTP